MGSDTCSVCVAGLGEGNNFAIEKQKGKEGGRASFLKTGI